MISVQIDPSYAGPTIVEMALFLPGRAGTFAWKDTAAELDLLLAQPEGDYTLMVPNVAALHRVSRRLGIPCNLPRDVIKNAQAINLKQGVWRSYTQSNGPEVAQTALLLGLKHHLNQGKDFPVIRKVMVECLTGDVSPVDADILTGLRSMGWAT